MPCWPTFSANLMELFIPPPEVKQILAWIDLDRTGRGEEAGAKLKARSWERGVKTQLLLPQAKIQPGDKGVDWVNVWNAQGRLGFPTPHIARDLAMAG